MKPALVFLAVLFLLVSCESPMDVGEMTFEDVSPSQFKKELLKTGSDYSPGYLNGNIRTTHIRLEWEECADERFLYYKLKRTQSGLEFLEVFTDVAETVYIDGNVAEDTEYIYDLTVKTRDGMTAHDTIKIKTPCWEAPTELNTNGLSNNDVMLSWNDISDSEDNFRVFLCEFNGEIIEEYVTLGNATEQIITGLEEFSMYGYKIRAESQYEPESPETMLMYFNTSEFELIPPSYLNVKQNNEDTVEIWWSDNSNFETGFLLERKINSGEYVEIADLGMNSEIYCDMELSVIEHGDTITYRLRTYNDYEEELIITDYSEEESLVWDNWGGFEEDFNDGLANNWIDDGSGCWSVINGEYVMTGSGDRAERISYYDEEFTEYSFEADLKKISGDHSIGLVFSSNGEIEDDILQEGYILLINDMTYSFRWRENGQTDIIIDWEYYSGLHPEGESNNVRICSIESMHYIFVNDELLIEHESDELLSGYFGFYAFDESNDEAHFDNVEFKLEAELEERYLHGSNKISIINNQEAAR